MEFLTILQSRVPSRLGKRFSVRADGSLQKEAVAQVTNGTATTLGGVTPQKLAGLISKLTEHDDIALMSGRFSGEAPGAAVDLVTERELARLTGEPMAQVAGVHTVNGRRVVARTKRSIEPGAWILIDADNPTGMPPGWASLTIQARLEKLEPIVPGISRCARIEYRASSARVVRTGDQPGMTTHAWLEISDRDKIEILREHLKVQTELARLSFDSPRHSRQDGSVIGASPRTLIDLAVFVPGRLVFLSRPNVDDANGYEVADAGVILVNPDGGVLDVSAISLPGSAELDRLRDISGRNLTYSRGGALGIQDIGTLTLETSIEVRGTEKPLLQWIDGMGIGDKLRCETPFRASTSEAAFIRIDENGQPFLHDVGSSTTFRLSESEAANLAALGQSPQSGTGGQKTSANTSLALANPALFAPPAKLPVAKLLKDPTAIIRVRKAAAPNHANVLTIARRTQEWDGVLAYDELADRTLLTLPVPGSRAPKKSHKARPLSDDDIVEATAWFNRKGFPQIGKGIVADAMEAVAKDNVISPVRHYLENLEARGVFDPISHPARLATLFQRYFGVVARPGVPGADPVYLAAIAGKFMVAAVARAMEPGCKVDTMLVLEGAQGAQKSTAIQVLASPEFFSDNLPTMGTKDAADHLRGKWFLEVGELSAMGKADVESLKAFLSRQRERFRPPYARKEVSYERRCVFVGTTNQDAYLRDETGNRRFWPVKVGKIDLAALKRDRDALWAEALHEYRRGTKWHLTDAESRLAASAQQDRMAEDVWQARLARALEGQNEVAISEAAKIVDLQHERIGRAEQNRISAILRALGFVREGKFTSGPYRHAARYVRAA